MGAVLRATGVSVLAILMLSACGERPALPQACFAARPADILEALRAVPHDVALQDGTRLSTCVERAASGAELQTLGAAVTEAADQLAQRARSDPGAAPRLGYLIGAVERGAARSNGVQSELAERIARTGAGLPRGALLRARAAGRRDG
jgi:hypothetical protein